ncbi:MAG: HD domain-containing protein [Candidatus Coatesbacteria bacterium]|jgi:putative nucleotidyltransferase with HDIG domain|nr:HD domain-containing protein [Candidatus Coatesbacteria bacterium]
MFEQLLAALPEFKLVEDPELREKCVECWMRAIEIGEWSFEEMLELPFTLLIDTEVTLFDHTRGVTLMADAMAGVMNQMRQDGVTVNHQYVIAGALLHDVGKPIEYSKQDGKYVKSRIGRYLRHPVSGVWLAMEVGLPIKIAHMIGSHSFEGDRTPRTPEAIIIHQADFTWFHSLKKEFK